MDSDEEKFVRELLAGSDLASLPHDYPLSRMAESRMERIAELEAALEYCREVAERCRVEPSEGTHGSDPFEALLKIEIEAARLLTKSNVT